MKYKGSAVVYSKKVEFLYNLVFETLDLLSKQKKQKREGSKDKGSFCLLPVTLGLVHLVIDDPVVVLDDSIFGEKESIDLKSNEKENQRRNALSVILPYFLLSRMITTDIPSCVSTNPTWG